MKLDDRDIAILRILSTEGRITKTALAERIGLSPTPAWDRLKRLEQAGLIEGYRAEIALKKLAPHVTVFVAAELADHTGPSFRAFEAAVMRYDEVVACWALGGGFDYLLQIVTRDIDAYQRRRPSRCCWGPGIRATGPEPVPGLRNRAPAEESSARPAKFSPFSRRFRRCWA